MDYIIGQSRPGQAPSRPARGSAAPDPATRPATAHGSAPPTDGFAPSGAVPSGDAGLIVDGNAASFMAEVIDDSRRVPVLVDFWASWCGPCKTLTPTLEKVTRAAGGRIKLVKIDVEAERALVGQLAQIGLPLQSIPTVAAFWQGQILDLFQGALPEGELKRFVEAVLKAAGGSMPAADLLAEARAALDEQRFAEAAELFSALLDTETESPDAWGGLVRALLALGDEDQAREVLEQVPARIAEHPEVSGARAALSLAAEGRAAAGALDAHHARVAADPDDHAARYELATALNGAGRRAEAADALLEILKRDRKWNDDAARLQLIRFFEAWGFEDPATGPARRRMSALLFS